MKLNLEYTIMLVSMMINLLLLIFAVNWRYFRDWIVIYLFKALLDMIAGSLVIEMKLIEYPVRLLPNYFQTSLFFELCAFPTLCILYNQVTKERGLWPIIYYAVLFSAGMTLVEYPLELYTDLIEYINWSWFTTLYTLTGTFLLSRVFIAFYRRGCDYFSAK
ncbi:CBO0543 family protein [Desulfolucanica intricata]|uniref:CBO0543 family protein n=1 Tax=Desulfolucanica intricata TaxID=1285191 RepID=UPI000ABB8EEC|nr:CBO0543 family protein [Desulfolucanica intricata]